MKISSVKNLKIGIALILVIIIIIVLDKHRENKLNNNIIICSGEDAPVQVAKWDKSGKNIESFYSESLQSWDVDDYALSAAYSGMKKECEKLNSYQGVSCKISDYDTDFKLYKLIVFSELDEESKKLLSSDENMKMLMVWDYEYVKKQIKEQGIPGYCQY